MSLPTPDAPGVTSLRARMLRGSFFEIAGYGTQQILRLGSNLILTRLLFPAAFGLSSLVFVLSTGLMMLSDVAVQPCVIQSKRGDDVLFLNTAFTIQALRGFSLALLMVILAKPAAWFYREPGLEKLVYIGSLQLVFNGLHSTSIFTLRRKLQLAWVNILELGQTFVSIPITIILARLYPSPWALIVGAICGAFVFSVSSHFLPVAYRNRFMWDRDAVDEISRFGRWVFGSSAASFLGGQMDRILLGRFLGAAWLGVFSVAASLSDMVGAVVNRLVNGVIYPVLSQAGREAGPNIVDLYYRLRLRLDALSMTSTGLLAGAGGWIVRTLWDERYADAAWILRVLCVRSAISLIIGPSETCLFSLGHTRYGFQKSVARLVGNAICIPAGWKLGGVQGVIWGTVVAESFTVFAVWPKSHSLGLLRLRRELLSVALFAAAFGIGVSILPLLPHIRLHGRH